MNLSRWFLAALGGWTMALAGEAPSIPYVPVSVQIGDSSLTLFVFRASAGDAEAISYYSPLFLFVEHPSSYGVFVEVDRSRGKNLDQNILYLYVLMWDPSVASQIRSKLRMTADQPLQSIPFHAVDVKLKVPSTGKWVNAARFLEGDIGVFGRSMRLAFTLSYPETEEILKQFREEGVTLRISYDYLSLYPDENVGRSSWQYIFPPGVLDSVFNGRSEVLLTEFQLAALISLATKEVRVKTIVSDPANADQILSRLPILTSEFEPISAGQASLQQLSSFAPPLSPEEDAPLLNSRIRHRHDLILKSRNRQGELSEAEKAELRAVNIYRVPRAQLERIHRSIVDLTTYKEGVSNVVIYRETAKDRIQAVDALGGIDPAFERFPFDRSVSKVNAQKELRAFAGAIRVLRPTPKQIVVARRENRDLYTLSLSPPEHFHSVAESSGENCVKIFVENPLSRYRSSYCVDVDALKLRYQRLEPHEGELEFILRPTDIAVQYKNVRDARVRRYAALGGHRYVRSWIDSENPSIVVAESSSGQRTSIPLEAP
ncbi:MAG TPA: hypothetical protein VI895_08015 [Bdellovibrionota bacterium]|nr:hypothetical protein [Bdellovibrionota bacterium]